MLARAFGAASSAMRTASLAAAVLAVGGLLVPAAAADGDPASYVQEVADEVQDYGQGVAEGLTGLLPACTAGDPQWVAECSDGTTFMGCGTDASAFYRCRLMFEGSGGDVDGSPFAGFVGMVGPVAGDGAGRALTTESRLVAAGANAADAALSEGAAWDAWTTAEAFAARDFALAAKQPYYDAARGLAIGVQSGSQAFAWRTLADTEAVTLAVINDGAHPDERLTASFDSGPVTLYATDKRSASDPCNPESGVRVFGSDCRGPMFVNASVQGSAACNAYTSIALAQPCGGFVSRDWDWHVQGNGLYPQPLQAARLSFGPDGRVLVHDALGLLQCNAPPHANGYWVESSTINVTESTFNEKPLGHQDSNVLAVFGDDAGTCTVASAGSGYTVTYDVLFNGIPFHAAGAFAPEGTAQDLAHCTGSADTRVPESASCQGVIHTGG